MINTYKESSLHRTLKELYALEEGSRTEVEKDGHIYDVLTKEGNVIEIQTQNLGKLLRKIQDALSKGRKCTVIHPVIESKTIETHSKDGTLLKKHKSPKKQNEYTMLRELTGIYPVLLEENFTLKAVFTKTTELRTETENPEQSENGRRRFKKNWQKADKKLEEITGTKIFSEAKDYLALLPKGLSEEFCAKDISALLKTDSARPKNAYAYANLMAWLFVRMNIFEQTKTEGRTKFYKIPEKYKK